MLVHLSPKLGQHCNKTCLMSHLCWTIFWFLPHANMRCTIAQALFNVGPSSNNAWPPSKPTLDQCLMAWWEICWIRTNSLARWPLTIAIISSGPLAVCHRLLDKPICRPTSFMVSIADRIPPVVHQWLWAAKSHQLGGPPATWRRQSEGGFCHWLTTDDTILSNNVASGPPAISRTSGGWYRAPLAAVTAVSGPPVARRTNDQGSDVGCVGKPLTVWYLVVETY